MFFRKRKRFNGDVALTLIEFGINPDEIGIFALLNTLDLAWESRLNVYESALMVAYGYAGGLLKKDIEKCRVFLEQKLQPTESDWIKKGLVRIEAIREWPAILQRRIDAVNNVK